MIHAVLRLLRGNTALGYREILRNKLEERAKVNVRYSLRAFARDLGISSSRLSAVIRGKQGLSRGYAEQIAKRLGFNGGESEYFCQLVLSEDARSKRAREIARERLETEFIETPISLSDDIFKMIADWYHYAIRQFLKVETIEIKTPAYIASRLGLTEFVTQQALDRLESLQFIKKEGGQYICLNRSLTSTEQIPSQALVKHHQQMLEKGQEALITQTVDEREFTSCTMAVNKANLPEFKQQLNKFLDDFNLQNEQQNDLTSPDEVYALSLNFFRLTNNVKDQ